jgi:hypothetical protein
VVMVLFMRIHQMPLGVSGRGRLKPDPAPAIGVGANRRLFLRVPHLIRGGTHAPRAPNLPVPSTWVLSWSGGCLIGRAAAVALPTG